jgi:hypothetical protein
MKTRKLRALTDDLVRELEPDTTANTEQLCHRVCDVMSRRVGKPILLRFEDLSGTGASGLWAMTGEQEHVLIVTTSRSWIHRLLILLHEVAHMLCGHQPVRLDAREGRRLLYPDLPSRMLTILGSRTSLSDTQEREADQVAGMLARALLARGGERPSAEPAVGSDLADPATRTWYSFGFTDQHHV